MGVRPTGRAAEAAQPRSRPVRPESFVATNGDSQMFSDVKTVIHVFERERRFASARVQELV